MTTSSAMDVDRSRVPYDGFVAVRYLSFQVRHNELYALLGTNGAGTISTLELFEDHRRAKSGPVQASGEARSTGSPLGPGRARCGSTDARRQT